MRNDMSLIKKGITSFIERLGYEIRRKPSRRPEHELSHFESCLLLLMGTQESVNIVQVGANDGSINDPLYGFTSK